MLTELSLENFKAWKKIDEMRLAPITGLFGTNSSGKSSILQFLLMLKQTAEADDRKLVLDFGDEFSKANLGSFKDVIYNHDENSCLSFGFEWKLLKKLTLKDSLNKKNLAPAEKLRFNSEICFENKKLYVRKMSYKLDDGYFELSPKIDKKSEYELDSSGLTFVRKKQRAWPIPSPIKFYGFPDQVNSYFQNAESLSDLQLELVNMLERIHYLGPLRDFPKRHYTSRGAIPSDLGPKGEYVVDAILASRDRGKDISPGYHRKKQTMEERIAFWLKELGLIHSFKVVPIATGSSLYEVKVRRVTGSSEVLITDVGFGVSQILPVLVMCYYVPEGSTILLEQPEIHLHPSVQMELADVFIDVAKNRNVQIILESHSEHLLNRLQRRLADESVTKDDVALYFCDAGTVGSRLNPLDIDMLGDIKNWPPNFFGDQFGEVAARQESQLKRQIKDGE